MHVIKCTCGATLEHVAIRPLPALSRDSGLTVRAVAYCCEQCDTVLGVESSPIERDKQMDAIKKTVESTRALQEQFMLKAQARAAAGK